MLGVDCSEATPIRLDHWSQPGRLLDRRVTDDSRRFVEEVPTGLEDSEEDVEVFSARPVCAGPEAQIETTDIPQCVGAERHIVP